MDTSNIGNRMKGYEQVSKTRLMKRTPVALRLDGKAFHTFCKGFEKPFDQIMVNSMIETTKYLCQNIQGCVFGYTQSDEITLILIDYQTFETDAWFDYEVQKLCSISASMATMFFNKKFKEFVKNAYEYGNINENDFLNIYSKDAMFDSRCFNISKEEVCNLIYWRQLDAIRNSILSIGQANFSQKELQNKSCNEIKEMLKPIGQNIDKYPTYLQRGSAFYKKDNYWIADLDMPILKGDNRKYVEKHIFLEED